MTGVDLFSVTEILSDASLNSYGEIITEYLTNYMCFIVLSIEIFSILFVFGLVKNVVMLLFVDTAVFIGVLVVGLIKMDLRGEGSL